jgi:hypothetical protein
MISWPVRSCLCVDQCIKGKYLHRFPVDLKNHLAAQRVSIVSDAGHLSEQVNVAYLSFKGELCAAS